MNAMRNLMILFLLSILLSACSHVGHFTQPVEDLGMAWEATAETARTLSGEVAARERELDQLMDRLPINKMSSTYIGENYLEEADQLKARLMGHKSAFDELAGKIEGFLEQWDEKSARMDQLQTDLSAGELPRDVMPQIQDLSAFRQQAADNMAAWTKDMNDVVEQFQKTETAYRSLLQ